MTALTVGITSALPDCKRGLAVNLAASIARDPGRRARVCVVDVDPLALDVTTRLAVRGCCVEDFADGGVRSVGSLGSVHEPPLWVLPSAGAGLRFTRRAAERALPAMRPHFDVVICDLAAGAPGPAQVGGLFETLDWLLLAVTPDVEPVEAAAGFLAEFDEARERGFVAPSVRLGLVLTGDEGSVGDASIDLAPGVVARALGRPVVGCVPQLWGRAAPNLGFGAALGIAELDDAVGALFERLVGPASGGDAPENADFGASSRAS